MIFSYYKGLQVRPFPVRRGFIGVAVDIRVVVGMEVASSGCGEEWRGLPTENTSS